MITKGFKSWKKQLFMVKDIEGLLVPGQEKAFMIIASKLPKNAVVVEIGSFKGKSTSCIALGSPKDTKIYVIDTFEGNQKDFSEGVQFLGGNFYNEFDSNLKKIGERRKITAIKGHSQTVGKKWNKKIDFLFIDGSHIYEDVKRDVEMFYPWLKPGGIIALHDVHRNFPGVLKVWNQEVKNKLLASVNIHTLFFGIKPNKGLTQKKTTNELKKLFEEITTNKVFVVIPVHNRIEATIPCLVSLAKQTYSNFEVIVVDDGSVDDTSRTTKKRFPSVKIIKGPGNWWWTRSMYEGVQYALENGEKTDYVLTMNNDCYFNPNYLKNIVEGNKKFPGSITGSLIVSAENPKKVIDAGILINWKTATIFGVTEKVSDNLKFFTDREAIFDFDTLPGKGTLVPFEVFEKIGNFNFRMLPHYIGDYEFFCRAKRRGFKLTITSKARLYNFIRLTGTAHYPEPKASYKQAFGILFGRKSKLNIIDHVSFLLLCCPRKYLFINLKQVFHKLINYSLMVFPLYYLKVFMDIYRKTKYRSRLFMHNLPIYIYQNGTIYKIRLAIHNLPIYFKGLWKKLVHQG